MSTLVVCLDRSNDIASKAGLQTPVVGWEAVRSLVISVGLADPEDSSVNSLLSALRITRDLRDDNEEAIVAVVSGSGESVVGPDRTVAAQLDDLIEEHRPDSAIVVVDSAEDERLVPILESRLPVDSVERVVVRQVRDLESTYYLMKQFLADEELRQTTLVPIGVALLIFPILATYTSAVLAGSVIAAVIGVFLLYKGLGIDEHVSDAPAQIRDALYSGQVSVVTYVVAAGLALVGLFVGVLGVSGLPSTMRAGIVLPAMQFAYDSVPWLAVAALAASAGRLLDEAIRSERLPTAFLNIPVGIIAVAIVIRGFSTYFLQRATLLDLVAVPSIGFGPVSVEGFVLAPIQTLAGYLVLGIIVSLVGVRLAMYFGEPRTDHDSDPVKH